MNVYVPHNRVSNMHRIKGEKWTNPQSQLEIVTLSATKRTIDFHQIRKDIKDLTITLSHLYLIDKLHQTTSRYMFFSSAHVTFSKIGHILSHRTNLH